jgi:transcriptional regulator with XRE-family HTH domain
MKQVRNLIGPQVRKLRFAQGLTQDQLAGRLQRAGWDVSRVSVAKIEAQLRWVTECELFMIAHVLQTPLEAFFPSAKHVKEFVSSPNFKRN